MNELELSKDALSAYLYDVGALEVARQQELEKQRKPCETLQHNRTVIQNLKEPEKPRYKESSNLSLLEKILICIFCAIIPGAITYVICIPLSWLFHFSKIPATIVVTCLGLIFGLLCAFDKSVEKTRIEENKKLRARYEQEIADYQWHIETEQKVRMELEAQIQENQAKVNKINDELKRQYSLGILHPQYQTMEAVLVMHNLLITGRCDTLRKR